MDDNLSKIELTFLEIGESNEKNESKSVELRKLFERVLKYLLNIPRREKHNVATLVGKLPEHPGTFSKKLLPKARLMQTFFNKWSHDNPNILSDHELEKHRLKLKEFIETAFDTLIKKSESFNLLIHSPSYKSANSPHEVKSYFKIAKNWYGKNKIIDVRFKRGTHQNNIYRYDHDEVYDKTLHKLKKIPCWDNDGYYSSSSNIPGFAMDYVDVKPN